MVPSQALEPSTSSKPARSARRFWLEVLLGFVCVFGGLALPPRGLGPLYASAHAALGNALLPSGALDSGVRLRFEATPEELKTEPWQATLLVQLPQASAAPVRVPIDFRVLAFLPTAAFIALALAVPLGSRRRHLLLLGIGLPLLELLLLGLMAAPLLSFLGGTGPVQAFTLSRFTHTVLQIVYRALVVPPGMTFAVPLVLWYALAIRLGGVSFRNPNA